MTISGNCSHINKLVEEMPQTCKAHGLKCTFPCTAGIQLRILTSQTRCKYQDIERTNPVAFAFSCGQLGTRDGSGFLKIGL